MKNRISLKRIIELVFIIFILTFSLYIYFDLKNIKDTLYKVETEKIVSLIKDKSPIIAPMLKFGFNDSLKQELLNMLKDKNILYLQIKSKNFNFSKIKNKPKFYVTQSIIYKNDNIGTLKIGYTDEYLKKSFFKKYFSKFIIYLIIILHIFIFIFLYLGNKISKLNQLAGIVSNLNFRKQSHIKLIGNYFEIVNITQAINKLLHQINQFHDNQLKLIKKLTSYKRYLESSQKITEMFSWQYDCEEKKFYSQNIKNLHFKNIDEFIDSIIDKTLFLNKIQEICKKKQEIEDIITLNNSENKKEYFKIFAKYSKQSKKDIIIGSALNVTDEIKNQEKIEYMAYHDLLTGLPNRTFLKNEVKTLMAFNKRHNKKLAFMFLDIDDFKLINDNFGHDRGDKLIKEISKRLKEILRKSDFVARIGGDEFAIILNEIKTKDDVITIFNKLKKNITKPINLYEDVNVYVTFSLGIAIFPDDTEDVEELYQYSDIAMYNAKQSGKDTYGFINDELKKMIKEYYSIVEEIKKALEKEDELILFFQPKINIKNNKIEGCEALIRWIHPKDGLIPPGKFIPHIEKSGLSSKLDSYILKKAVIILSEWQKDEKLKDLVMAINITAAKFKEINFIDELKNLIEKYKINPSKLQIEITESMGIKNIDYTISVLNQIRDININIAIDDFGTGYSSLNYIKNIPFDVLKIDQSFIRDLFKSESNEVITKMIVEIAKVLKKTTVAEGVEDEKTLKEVKKFGVDIVQGYYFSKPLPENEFTKYVYNFQKNQ